MKGNFDVRKKFCRIQTLADLTNKNVDENQEIEGKTCTFKGAYKQLTNLNLTN